MPERRPHTGEPVSKSWFLNGNRLRFRCSHAHEPFYPKDPLPDRIFLPYGRELRESWKVWGVKSDPLKGLILTVHQSILNALMAVLVCWQIGATEKIYCCNFG